MTQSSQSSSHYISTLDDLEYLCFTDESILESFDSWLDSFDLTNYISVGTSTD